jgi:hypothetical protein
LKCRNLRHTAGRGVLVVEDRFLAWSEQPPHHFTVFSLVTEGALAQTTASPRMNLAAV